MSANILIVDDEANIRMMMRLALEHVGYRVEQASDGPEGLEKYGDGANWDLVLLDQRMPGMTGMDVQEQIRKRNPKARIIMATAFGTIDLATKAMQSGATDFLRKPFTADTLRLAVQSALNRDPEDASGDEKTPVAGFDRTTINGFRLKLAMEVHDRASGETLCKYHVDTPSGETVMVKVILPVYIMELVKAYADTEYLPFATRFWQAMCEEALANYLWQQAELPPDNILRITELSSSLQRWIDGVLTVEMASNNA